MGRLIDGNDAAIARHAIAVGLCWSPIIRESFNERWLSRIVSLGSGIPE
ncbi:hypothetical protein [Photorhabdus hindustanensis]|nr:hypothetical protein [Photorhabdus hindustanensis]